MVLVLNEIGIPHDGCDGEYKPYSDGSMMCYCGASLPVTSDDVFLGNPVGFLRDDC